MKRNFAELTTTTTTRLTHKLTEKSRRHWPMPFRSSFIALIFFQFLFALQSAHGVLHETSPTNAQDQSVVDFLNQHKPSLGKNVTVTPKLHYVKPNNIFSNIVFDGSELVNLHDIESTTSHRINRLLRGMPMTWMNEQSSGVVRANHRRIDMPTPKYFWEHHDDDENAHEPRTSPKNPVILIPGDGGSQLEARLNRSASVHYFCKLKTGWYALWLNLESLLPYSIDCFTDNMRFVFDETNGTYENVDGVEIRVPGFGSTETIEWLDSRRLQPTHYFANIADYLIKANYTRNVTLRGTPYDFREGPYQDTWWYDAYAKLVEETYEKNGRAKVVLLAHSMGNLHTWWMLRNQSQEWKDKYVECFISLSAPWTGAAKAIRVSISGDNLGIFTIDSLAVRPAERTWPSLYSLMPSPAQWRNRTFVSIVDPQTKKIVKNYTLDDMEHLFMDMEYPTAWPIYRQNGSPYWVTPETPPGVRTHCLFGVGVPTEEHFVYTLNAFPNQQPIIGLGDGDGTVNRDSMEMCGSWAAYQNQTVTVERFVGAGHLSILSSPAVIAAIGKILGFTF